MNTKELPLVSVVAVCYNHASFLEEAILSIVNQSYTNKEIIVYDNSSTDNSYELLQQLQERYGFTLIKQKNIGQSRTVNRSLKNTTGKYISFISTDDIWTLDKLEIAVDFLESCDSKIAVCGGTAITIDKYGKIFRKQTFSDYRELTFDDVFLNGSIIPALTSVIRRNVLVEIGGISENVRGEDTPMWLKITYHGYRIAYLNKLLGYYRHHDNNITHQRDNLIEEIRTMYSEYSHLPGYEKALSNKFFRTFSRYAKIDKPYSLKFLKYVKFKHLSSKEIFYSLIFLFLPYGLIRRITRVI